MSISEVVRALRAVRKTRGFSTLLGIGPMSPTVLQASLELSQEQDFPILFIASRNQIDVHGFGGGYVCGWDQSEFCDSIKDIAQRIRYDGMYFVCRDHGGPWQRDEEYRNSLSEDDAMARALESYYADVEAGFDLLHIDPTKDPHITGTIPMELVLRRTVELIESVEEYRRRRGRRPIGYEVGTEETNGGLTSDKHFSEFIARLCSMLEERGLPKPDFIVGQTGTLTRLTENVGHYSWENAKRLSEVASRYGMELKEHNSDYLPEQILLLHPALGVGASNVAPEFGTEETRAYIALAEVEETLFRQGLIRTKSDLVLSLRRSAVEAGRWRKWMVGEAADYTVEQVLSDERLTERITDISGHYVFLSPAVAPRIQEMLDNLEEAGVPARRFVVDRIKRSIGKYVTAYNLRGLTSCLRTYLK